MPHLSRRFLAPALAACAVACTPAATVAPKAAPPQTGLAMEDMDPAVAAGDDFFARANGAWFARTEIPPDRSSYGKGAEMSELTDKRTAELIKEAAAGHAPEGSDARKVGDVFAAFMDEAGIEAKGLTPLQGELAAVASITDAKSLAKVLGSRLRADVDLFNATNTFTPNLFGLWVAQDLNDPSKYSPFLVQGGLGMPDRDYYLTASPRMEDIRTKYQAHIAATLTLAGVADAQAKAARIYALEKKIAEVHSTQDETQEVTKGNNHWTKQELSSRAPGLDWSAYLASAGLDGQQSFVVWQPKAVTGISALVRSVPVSTWKEYLTYHVVADRAEFLPKAFVEERFSFFGKTLSGRTQVRARWKRAVDVTNDHLGEVVGKLFVERYFPASEKARAEEMVRNEIAAFGRRIDGLEWMAPETKAKAKAKLAVLKVGVGYPDKWRDYSGLEILPGDAMGNAQRSSLFELKTSLAKLGQPVDRGEWVMNPQLVNAVNLPAMNAMNFPAAILMPPNFDPTRPVAMDYGATGATIGHEISHSFDDQGALFDAEGRLNNWWTKEDFAHFNASAEALVKQYDGYRPFPDLAVNGKQTVSENIADVAGLAVAYDAYRLSQGGKEGPTAQGLTGDQQFFLSYAQSWQTKVREPALRQRIITDGHAPAEYRADTVRNLDAWYTAFDVKPGQKLYLAPEQRVRVW